MPPADWEQVLLDCPKSTAPCTGCDWCGRPLTGRRQRWCSGACSDAFNANHLWSAARDAAKRRDGYQCVQCGSSTDIEVNHISPRMGRGYDFGCWNHLDELETLCRRHHLAETARQRRAQRGAVTRTSRSSRRNRRT